MAPFQRVDAHPAAADALELAARLAVQDGRGLAEFLARGADPAAIQHALDQARSPVRMHGRRAEEMFGYVVAALGAAEAVKREDAGALLVRDGVRVAVPDFRLVLRDRREVLVEVKNWHRAGVDTPVRLSRSYLGALAAYGDLFARPVYVAVYWSRWRVWSLHPVAELLDAAARAVPLTFLHAVPASHMALLGDESLATVFPLTLRLEVAAERRGGDAGNTTYAITVRQVRYLARGTELLDRTERRIAWNFMLHGRWGETGPTPVMDGDNLTAIEVVFRPHDVPSGDDAHPADASPGFAIVAAASSLASAQFDAATTHGGEITRIHLDRVPEPPHVAAAPPTRGPGRSTAGLPLWRFRLEPRPIHAQASDE